MDDDIMNYSPPRTSGLAIASLVFGILGWTLLPLIGSIVAVILGHMGRSEIRRSAAHMEGDALAIAGLVLGYIAIGLSLLALLLLALVLFGGLVIFGLNV